MSQYWIDRQLKTQDMLMKKGEDLHVEMIKTINSAIEEYDKQINAFYGRFAVGNEMSYAEAKKILTTSERKKFQMSLDEYVRKARTLALSDEWMKELDNASTVYRISRLKALQIELRNEIEVISAQLNKGLNGVVSDVYHEGYYHTIYDIQVAEGAGVSFEKINPNYVEIIASKPWAADGRTFSERIWGQRDVLVDYMNKRVQRGLLTGEAKSKIIRDLSDKFKTTGSNAGRLIMTEAAYYSAASTLKGYKSQGVKKFTYIATLDEKTCEICQPLDGMSFNVSDYQSGVNAEPMHAHCRCHTYPVVDDLFAGLFGADDETTRRARGADGKPYKVDGKLNYKDWKEKYV